MKPSYTGKRFDRDRRVRSERRGICYHVKAINTKKYHRIGYGTLGIRVEHKNHRGASEYKRDAVFVIEKAPAFGGSSLGTQVGTWRGNFGMSRLTRGAGI
jgi:hypothetical protein